MFINEHDETNILKGYLLIIGNENTFIVIPVLFFYYRFP